MENVTESDIGPPKFRMILNVSLNPSRTIKSKVDVKMMVETVATITKYLHVGKATKEFLGSLYRGKQPKS